MRKFHLKSITTKIWLIVLMAVLLSVGAMGLTSLLQGRNAGVSKDL